MHATHMAEKVVGFFIRLSPGMHADLAAWAKEDGRSLNNLIVHLLRRALTERRGM